jgi:error-prone DNA polymerase
VAKALGFPPHVVDRMAQVAPHARAGSIVHFREQLAHAAGGESPLFELLLEMVAELAECPRHLSLHSGGMLLSRTPLHEFTPVQVSANKVKVGQFDKNDVEALGLIKLDVLALRMLATLSETTELIRKHQGIDPDIDNLPLDDVATFELIRSGHTIGLFQIESQGQIHLLAQHQPENFDDLISEIALFRPGPLQSGMVNPFIRRRQGLETVTYEHPDLKPILEDTYGIILFQEQVLDVAHRFAGMSLQEADDFRALMSKFRDPEEMEGMREKFVRGAMGRGVGEHDANKVFNTIAHFVGFGFCRSHAAAFAKTVYQSAWLKCHYPAAFMAAIMQHRPGMYNLMTLEQEAKRLGVPVLTPSINRSSVRYELERRSDGVLAIRKPLAVIAQMSSDNAKAIMYERFGNGAFSSVEDLCRRVPLPRDVLDALARSGALDELAGSSRRALWEIGVALRRLPAVPDGGMLPLFELPLVDSDDMPELPELKPFERLSWDYATHRAARHHPMILIRRTMNDLEARPIITAYHLTKSSLRPKNSPHPKLTIAGIAILRQMPPTAKGVMFITLEDETAFIQCVIHPGVVDRLPVLLTSPALIVQGYLHITGDWRGLVVTDAWKLEGMIGGYTGFPSASGGTDRHVIEREETGVAGDGPEVSEYVVAGSTVDVVPAWPMKKSSGGRVRRGVVSSRRPGRR